MGKRKEMTTMGLVFSAMMVALVVVSNFLRIKTAGSALHVANAVCLLAGFLFGGVQGGLIAGLGSALYDLTNPDYMAGAWITFLTKGAMALVCGLMAHNGLMCAKPRHKLVMSAVLGAITYIFLYMVKSYIELRLVSGIHGSISWGYLITEKLVPSSINGLFAVIVAPLLYLALMPSLKKAGLAANLPVSPLL